MKKSFKKAIALFLSTLMIITAIPFSAFAWDDGMNYQDAIVEGHKGFNLLGGSKHNGDFISVAIMQADANGVITVKKGQNFSIELNAGKWTGTTSSNYDMSNRGWHYGTSTDYTMNSTTSNQTIGYWNAVYNGNNVQSAVSGTVANQLSTDNGNRDLRAGDNNGGSKNDATGVFEFTTSSFPQVNTPGEYTLTLKPYFTLAKWTYYFLQGNKWAAIQGYNTNIDVTIKVVDDYTFKNAAGTTVKTVTAAGDADALKSAPANTASSIVSNNNGKHTTTTYSWPTASSNSVFQETTTNSTVDCNLVDVPDTAITETCTSKGRTADQKCDDCGYIKSGSEVQMAAHDYYYVDDENNSTHTIKCNNCTFSAPGNLHNYKNYTSNNNATCAGNATETGTCDCGATNTREIAGTATGAHSIKYTNNGDGTHTVYCENCNTMTETVAHNFATKTADKVDPTNCVTPGSEAVYTCACGATTGGTTINPDTSKESTLHSYTLTEETDSTCTVRGTLVYTCSNDATHTYTEYKELDPDNHKNPLAPVVENETAISYDSVIKCDDCKNVISRETIQKILIVDKGDTDKTDVAEVVVNTVEEEQVATVTVDNVADEDARFIGWFDAEGNLLSMEKDYVITGEESAIKAVVDNEAKNDVNATVKNNIGANFYIDTLYYVDDPETDITITYNQDINAYTNRFVQKTVKVKDLDFNADMQSIINIDVAPAQIDKKITISFEDENGDVISFNKTVMDYCNDVINGAHSFADKNAAKKVINYAYAVQQYFFINEFEGLRSIDVDATYDVAESVTFDRVSDYEPLIKRTSTCPITASEISIVAVTDTGVRIYYTGDASDLEFQASNGYTVTKGDGYVEISGIKAADLGNEFVVQAKNSDNKVVFQAKLSAMSYVYLALQDGKKWSVDYNRFLGAFYEYWQAAQVL